jgi:hypothetical protein
MLTEADEILDDILCRWAQWCRPVSTGRGFGHQSLVCGQYRTSRQYDDVNGALDDAIEHQRMKAVDFQVGEMAEPWRTAVHSEARRLVVGVDVFVSPRLPRNLEEREACIVVARAQIQIRLQRAGVM